MHKCMEVLKASEVRWNHAGRLWCGISSQASVRSDYSVTRDILYELACVGELPLPQPSLPSMKREREWEPPSSGNATKLTSGPMSQNDPPYRVFAASRRVREEPLSINQTQQLQTSLPRHEQSQATPPPSVLLQYLPLPPSQQAPSRSGSHSQMGPSESQQTTSTTSPFNHTDLNVFALPVYSSELGRIPLHEQMTFTAQAHLLQLQPQPLDPETYWYTASQPTSHADASGTTWSSSYGPHYPSASAHQQEPYSHHQHAPQGIPVHRFPSASEASSVAESPHGMDAAEVAPRLFFDAMGRRTGYTQQRTSRYGLGPMPSSLSGMGSGSMVSTPPQSSSGPSIENVYRRLGTETMPGGHYPHQHQTILRQQEQQPSSYPFVLDGDAVTVWSNAPTGFECVIFILLRGAILFTHPLPFLISTLDEWSTFLSNFSELTQGNVQDHSGGQSLHQHQHQRVPQQHEEQLLSYPFTSDSDMRSNAPTEFEWVFCPLLLFDSHHISHRFSPCADWTTGCQAYERQ